MVSKHSPATPDSVPAAPAADPIVVLREAIAVAERAVVAIADTAEALRLRGPLRGVDRGRMQVHQNDLSYAHALLEQLRKTLHYVERVRAIPGE